MATGVGKNGKLCWKEGLKKVRGATRFVFFAQMKEASSFGLHSHPPCAHQSPKMEKAKFTIFSADCRFALPVG